MSAELAATGRSRVILLFRESQLELREPLAVSGSGEAGAADLERVRPWRATLERELRQRAPRGFEVTREYQVLPLLAGVLSAGGLAALERSATVEAIQHDAVYRVLDVQSDARIRAPEARTRFNVAGRNVRVMVLDTGIDRAHRDFAGAIVQEQCALTDAACPGSNTTRSASATDGEGHGTYVSGIILGRGALAPRGVAPEAQLVAFKTLRDDGTGVLSDAVFGFDHVLANPQLNVRVINMSIGGGMFTADCDATSPAERTAVERLRLAGVLVVAASGNDGSLTGVATPGCLSGVVTVGSVSRAGSVCAGRAGPVSCFSNGGPGVDLLAPGDPILSSLRGGTAVEASGTSAATPVAAGVAALLFSMNPRITPEEVRAIMVRTGVPTTDTRNNLTRPLVDAVAAANEVALTLCTGRPDGAPCNDFDLCTTVDRCQAGQCLGTAPKSCPVEANPCRPQICEPRTGACILAQLSDGSVCDDRNGCTVDERCRAGRCAGTRKTCPGDSACAVASCDDASGECRLNTFPDGSVCGEDQTCRAGVCLASSAPAQPTTPAPSTTPDPPSTPVPPSTPAPPTAQVPAPSSAPSSPDRTVAGDVEGGCQSAPGGALLPLLLSALLLRPRIGRRHLAVKRKGFAGSPR